MKISAYFIGSMLYLTASAFAFSDWSVDAYIYAVGSIAFLGMVTNIIVLFGVVFLITGCCLSFPPIKDNNTSYYTDISALFIVTGCSFLLLNSLHVRSKQFFCYVGLLCFIAESVLKINNYTLASNIISLCGSSSFVLDNIIIYAVTDDLLPR